MGHAVLPFRAPYEAGRALASLEAHAVPRVEKIDAATATVRRLLEVDGALVPVTVRLRSADVTVDVPGRVTEDLAQRVRRWFDLDLDPAEIGKRWSGDPHLGCSVRERPGLRVIGHPAGFEAAVGTVLGQHVSVAAARTFTGRVAAAYGTPGPGGLWVFPSPEVLAASSPVLIQAVSGVTAARARTVHALAMACADGLVLDPDDADPGLVQRRLLALPGVGPWTVAYLAVRVLCERDAFPAGDLVLRRALGGLSARKAEALSQSWRPLRAYALVHLWSTVWPSR